MTVLYHPQAEKSTDGGAQIPLRLILTRKSFIEPCAGRMTAVALSCLCGDMCGACAVTLLFCGRKIANALSCECGRTAFFGAAFGLSPLPWMRFSAFVPFCFFVQRRGRRYRAEWDAVPRPAGALPPSPPRATAPLDGRNALRVGVYSLVRPADSLSFLLHSPRLGGVSPSGECRPPFDKGDS